MILLIKYLSDNILNNYHCENKQNIESEKEFEPEIDSFEYFDELERKKNILKIYKKFELIDRHILQSIIDNYSGINNFLSECKFNDGKIIIQII